MAAELKKGLGLVHVFAIAAGAMISSGLFVLPGMAYEKAGPAMVFSYLVAGLLAATGLLSTAELATAMPKAGSDYFFITRSMGPAVGTVAGLFNWVSFSLKAAFALVGMAAFIRLLAPVDIRLSGTVLGLAFVVLNLVGVKEAARVQLGLVAVMLGLMALYVVRGLPAVDIERFTDVAPGGAAAVFSTAGFVFVAYGGLLKIASVAEEIRNPGRTIPLGLILSLVVGILLYALMVFVTVGVLPAENLSGSLTPIADGAMAFMGPKGQMALGLAGAMAFLTTANAGILTGSRYLLAMGRDGMLPPLVSRVGRRFGTPYAAILLTGALVIVPLFVDLYILVEAASIGLVLTNILANLAVIVLRESGLQNYRPEFRSPLYPWVQVAGIIGFVFVLFQMGMEAFTISAVLVVVGFGAYWFYGRKRVRGESALLHLLQRLTDRQLVTGTLEDELKEIVHERDQIVLDRFDRLVEQAVVLDLDEPMGLEAFFAQAAERLAPHLNLAPKVLAEMLRRREAESSTLLSPSLAVPHVVVPGQERFNLLMARAQAGVRFSDDAPEVRTIFLLAGTRDERNFHLRALAAIAQIVQEKGFERRWLEAKSEQGLRDVVLLSSRKRHADAGEASADAGA